jgi:amino acid adenylation domain-containing protein
MVPAIFIKLDALPLTSNGKVDRKALPKPESHHIPRSDYEAPVTETEVALAQIWQNLLNIGSVSRNDNFFSLGGHSLLAIRLMSLIQQTLECSLSLKDLFENPVIKDLSVVLDGAERVSDAPMLLADRSQRLPLSWAQQRLWFITQLDGGNAAYHILDSIPLNGELSADALEKALDTIVTRHEALRTVFREVDGHVWQEIIDADASKFHFEYRDLRRVDDRESALEIESSEVKEVPFDLTTGPLIRGRLVQLADREHVLLLTMHHIVSDAWSMGVFMNEFNTLYDAYCLGKSNPLPPLTIQYADYAVWQRTQLKTELLAQQSSYWQDHLAGVPLLLDLPYDHKRPTTPSFRGGVVGVELDSTVTEQVRALALSEGMTMHMVLHAVWTIMLSRLSGQEQIVVGTPVANRQRRETENLIGFFVNNIAMCVDLRNPESSTGDCNQKLSGKELLSHVKSVILTGYANQDVPFEQVVELVQPERSLSYNPLFQVMFDLDHDEEQGDLVSSGLSSNTEGSEFNGVEQESDAVAQLDLALSLTETQGRIEGSLEYALDLFNDETIKRWSGYFCRLVAEFVANLDTPINELAMLPNSECQHLLIDLNQTRSDFAEIDPTHTLFERQAAAAPDAIAVAFEDQSISYESLNQRANQLAHHLINNGVKPDTLVGLCCERSIEMVVGLLGILKAGGAYVPLDPSYPEARLAYQIEDAGLAVIVTQEKIVKAGVLKVMKMPIETVCLDHKNTLELLQGCSNHNPKPKDLGLNSRHLAYVIYTSGTTGNPKGVMIEHRSLNNLINDHKKTLQVSTSSRVLQFASIAFDVATCEFFMALAQGGVLVMLNKDEVKSADAVTTTVRRHKITHAFIPPALLSALDIKQYRDVKTLVVGGEPCPEKVAALWSHGRNFINAYGPSEVTICSTTAAYDSTVTRLHIGKPNENTQVYICDQNGKLVPHGVPGELLIAGVGLARGYLNKPELTAEKFVANPFYDNNDMSSSKLLYKTGDLVRWLPEGNIDFIGRIDTQVKLRGHRIELGEVEAQLLSLEKVRDAVVILDTETNSVNNREDRLAAYYTSNNGDDIKEDVLRRLLSVSLPEYMVPAIYIRLDVLPISASGKVDRKVLPKPEEHNIVPTEYEAPEGNAEKTLVSLCEEILGVTRVSRNDNFFAIGGTSITAIKLVAQLKKRGYILEFKSVFTHKKIKGVATSMEIDSRQTIESIDQGIIENPVRLNESTALDATPLFLLHEASGELFYYSPLAKELESYFQVYGLALIGTSINIKNLNLRTLASQYIESIKKVQAQGPYRLAGWSVGGQVACEVAYQLIGEGEEVEFLGMLDSGRQYKYVETPIELLMKTIDDVEKLNGNIGFCDPKHRYGDNEGNTEFAEANFGAKVNVLPLFEAVKDLNRTPVFDKHDVKQISASRELAPIIHSLRDARGMSNDDVFEKLNTNHFLTPELEKYCVPYLPIDVSLFYTEENDDNVDDWQLGQGDRLTTCLVDGDHRSMMSAPHVSDLAMKIHDRLDHLGSSDDQTRVSRSRSTKEASDGLFFVPGIFGVPSTSSAFSASLKTNRDASIIELDAPGLDFSTVPSATIERYVEDFLLQIQSYNFQQPIRLIGHGFGAWIVYQLALALERNGMDLGAVIMISPQNPISKDCIPKYATRSDGILSFLRKLEQLYSLNSYVKRSDLLVLTEDQQINLIREKIATIKELSPFHSFAGARQLINLFLHNSRLTFSPESQLNCRCVLVKCSEKIGAENDGDPSTYAWEDHFSNFDVMTLNENEMTVLHSTHVGEIVQALFDINEDKKKQN